MGGGGLRARVGLGFFLFRGGWGGFGGRVGLFGEGFGAGGVVAFFSDDGDGAADSDSLGSVLDLGELAGGIGARGERGRKREVGRKC